MIDKEIHMQWCWELSDWPKFKYDKRVLEQYAGLIFKNSGLFFGLFKALGLMIKMR